MRSPVELGAVVFALVVGALVFWRGESDPFTTLRATLLVATGLFVAAVWVTRGIEERSWPQVPRPIGGAAAAVMALLVVGTFVAPISWIAVVGPLGRSNGLALYLACGVLFVAAGQLEERAWSIVATTCAALLGVVSAYGVLQWLGADPFSWPAIDTSSIFSTFGQSNFASGWVAVMIPFAALLVIDAARPQVVRWVGAVVVLLALLLLRATGAFQGIPAVVAGLAPLAYVFGRRWVERDPPRNGRRLRLVGAGVLVVVLAIVIIPTTRSTVRDNLDSGFHEREMLWTTAGRMVRDAPVLGKGTASYALLFHRFETTEHAVEFSDLTADAPHSVPLEMAASGGVLLALAYLTFVVLAGARLVAGMRRSPTLLLAAVGGAWLAYQVQAAVSLDVPSLASAHWILAGGIVALTTDSEAASTRMRATWSGLSVAAGAVLVLAVSPWLTRPLRADIAIRVGLDQARAGQPTAVASLERATHLAPWNSQAWADLAGVYQQAQRPDDALAAGAEAVRRNPGSTRYRTSEAKLAAALGKQDVAARYYREAIANQPRSGAVWLDAAEWAATVPSRASEAKGWHKTALRLAHGRVSVIGLSAQYLANHGEAKYALDRVRTFAREDPQSPDLQLILGDVYDALGRFADARGAYETALRLAPDNAEARSRVASITVKEKQ